MKDAPRLRGGLALRVLALFLGLFLIAVAIVCLLESRLGLAPWDVLHLGLARHSPLTIGTASVVVGLIVLFVAWAAGQPPGFGTVANAIAIGVFVDLLLSMGSVSRLSDGPLAERGLLLVAGVVVFGIGSAFYIGAGLGAGPRDSLMLVLSRRTGVRIAVVRACLEISALAVGFLLGGTVGVGTVLVALLLGPSVEGSFWLVRRVGLAYHAVGQVEPQPLGPV
jgi:uncharacterized membrane protein YczE